MHKRVVKKGLSGTTSGIPYNTPPPVSSSYTDIIYGPFGRTRVERWRCINVTIFFLSRRWFTYIRVVVVILRYLYHIQGHSLGLIYNTPNNECNNIHAPNPIILKPNKIKKKYNRKHRIIKITLRMFVYYWFRCWEFRNFLQKRFLIS